MTVALDRESYAFPRHRVLADATSALLLFCSGRMGAADGHWVREAGLLDVWCLDWDEKTLAPFWAEYPAEWRYIEADAFVFAAELARSVEARAFDLVAADMPSQWADRLWEALPGWCALAGQHVVCSLWRDSFDGDVALSSLPEPPAGWRYVEMLWRTNYAGGLWWLVLERA